MFIKINDRIVNLNQVIDVDMKGERVVFTTNAVIDGQSCYHIFEDAEAREAKRLLRNLFYQESFGLLQTQETQLHK